MQTDDFMYIISIDDAVLHIELFIHKWVIFHYEISVICFFFAS